MDVCEDMPTDQWPLSRTQLCPLSEVIRSLVDPVEEIIFFARVTGTVVDKFKFAKALIGTNCEKDTK